MTPNNIERYDFFGELHRAERRVRWKRRGMVAWWSAVYLFAAIGFWTVAYGIGMVLRSRGII